ncbi:MAG: Fe-S cluster assembly ATPase SufC [Alphaproteobacteria bacterium]|jgi:Fe-S cluster assembly ATP-binding protein|nr:Fe-S cluster assembly ATPase SufC [Alphaproteobacteria bacterium]
MFEVKDLKVIIKENDEEIVKGIDFQVEKSSINFLLGKNGSGKSSFLMSLFGSENYEVSEGGAFLDGQDVLELDIEEKIFKGMFLSFQSPVGIPGLTVSNFLKHSINSVKRGRGEKPLSAPQFFRQLREAMEVVGIDDEWLKKDINVGFSGGEKKKLEMLQMILLEPKIAFLDEPDSGVDVNAVELIASCIKYMKERFGTAFVVVSHYEKLLRILDVDRVSIMKDGKIVASGGKELAEETLEKGFE